MEMSLWEDQRKVGDRMCPLLRALDRWYPTPDAAQTQVGARLGGVRRGSRSSSRPSQKYQHGQGQKPKPAPPQSHQAGKAKGKGRKGKGTGKDKGKQSVQSSPFHGRFQRFCCLVTYGLCGFPTSHYSFSQPLSCSQFLELDCRETRVDGGLAQGISRPIGHARGHQALGRKDGERIRPSWYQKPPSSIHVPWQGQGSFGGSYRQGEHTVHCG